MASTYFDGGSSEIQSSADGLQTLYLMNPTYVPYSDTTTHHSATPNPNPNPNLLLLNPNALNLPTLSHAPPLPSHLLGHTIPTNRSPFLQQHHDIPAFHYNLWGSVIDHQTPSSPAAAASSTTSGAAPAFRRTAQQGLSLSLSPQHTVYNRSLSGELEVPAPGQPRVAAVSPARHGACGDDMQIPGNCPPTSVVPNLSVILGSKYLKAAQELLDEVVNVGKGIEKGESIEMEGTKNKEKMKANRSESESGNNSNIIGDASSGGNQGEVPEGAAAAELSTAQRQELQMKKSKLVHMLDEVERRYRQYRHQMQLVISSFEQAAGYGAAKSYTALALKTISKQFRCLKDAISSLIKATSKSLGEEDCLGAKVEGSRLRYVDHHLRQQRALQQLGMIQHNAWRPQRGLPERAVSILRAWLFEHFLHPYPKDSDKVMLAKQTGLTRSQVSNWFINARVRLWKPMVEEMYLEETKEQQEQDQQNNNGATRDNTTIRSSKDQSRKDANSSNNNNNGAMLEEAGGAGPSNIIRSFDQMKALQPKSDQRFNINQTTSLTLPDVILSSNSAMGLGSGVSNNVSVDVEMKPRNYIKDGHNKCMSGVGGGGTNYSGFSMQDIGRFNVDNVSQQQLAPRFHGNGVSLTLGLPHSNDNLPLSATQHGFLSHNIHLGSSNNGSSEFFAITTPPPPPPPPSSHNSAGTTTYDNIDIQNRKSFAAQLLPDFVT